MLSEGGEIYFVKSKVDVANKVLKIKDLDVLKKELDLDMIKKEVEKKELKLAQLEERIKLMAAKKELDKKILDLEKQALLLEKSMVPEPTLSAPEPPVVAPPPLLPLEKELTWNDFMLWRQNHPGPKTRRSFHFWVGNGGRDLPSFTWRRGYARARRGGLLRGNSGFVFNNYSYS
ncbi:uncharacterized protein LOC136087763 isoform X2 [Hydra vulgaris]|uniref:Uncharacterized protein LOC136079589 isoform X3 n=1 Tax=Hydra vulgaris TaxID=6087 RepID=A0ABM4BR50_HYDVU